MRVDMTRCTASLEDCRAAWERLGGRGLSAAILNDEVPPTCHPLGRENKLILAPGLLAGSSAPTSGRISAGGKSPLTGGIKEANAGGTAAQLLAKLGIKGIIIQGEPPEDRLHLIHITQAGAAVLPAEEHRGLGNYELTARLRGRYGTHAGTLLSLIHISEPTRPY